MDRAEPQILAVVAADPGENPGHRRGKGSSATFVSRGLVDPKATLNMTSSKGKQVHIPVPRRYVTRQRKVYLPTLRGRLSRAIALFKRISPGSTVKVRTG